MDNNDLDAEDKMSMLEWLANEYMRFGCALEFVTSLTNRSVLHGVWRNRRDTLFFFLTSNNYSITQ